MEIPITIWGVIIIQAFAMLGIAIKMYSNQGVYDERLKTQKDDLKDLEEKIYQKFEDNVKLVSITEQRLKEEHDKHRTESNDTVNKLSAKLNAMSETLAKMSGYLEILVKDKIKAKE